MTTAREIVARAVAGDDWREGEYRTMGGMGEVRDADELNGGHRVTADDILTALTAAGFRIVGPGEVDKETVERCAALCEQPRTFIDGTVAILPSGRAYATAIRTLAEENRP